MAKKAALCSVHHALPKNTPEAMTRLAALSGCISQRKGQLDTLELQ